MDRISYIDMDKVPVNEWITLMNAPKTRAHLVHFKVFNEEITKQWLLEKLEEDRKEGAYVRAVIYQDRFVGWAAIQEQNEQYEVAIVIGEEYWGLGKRVFYYLLDKAKELGHEYVYLHLLETRREYRFLKKIAENVTHSRLLGRAFTTYKMKVD